MNAIARVTVLLGAAFMLGGRLPAAEIRVPEEIATIQDALDLAEAGDVVTVGPGEYLLSESLRFNRADSLTGLRNSITLRSSHGAEQTILRKSSAAVGKAMEQFILIDQGEDDTTILDGFTLESSYGDELVNGIVIRGSSPTVRNCVVVGYGVTKDGVLIEESKTPTLQHCTFLGSGFRGIRANRSEAVLESCRLVLNEAGGLGAFESQIVMRDCTVAFNELEIHGDSFSAIRLERCTIAHNRTTAFSISACELALKETIVWGNVGGTGRYLGTSEVENCCIEGLEPDPVKGIISSDPMFLGWASEEVAVSDQPGFQSALLGFRLGLSSESPCVGTGENQGNMGADLGVSDQPGFEQLTLRLGSGEFEIFNCTLTDNISLVGAGPEHTVITGEIRGLQAGCEISGMTVLGGITVFRGGGRISDCAVIGGVPGIFATESSLELAHCLIRDGGDGIQVKASNTPVSLTLSDTVIRNNRGNGILGGGSINAVFERCVVSGNSGGGVDLSDPLLGRGIPSAVFTDSEVSNNLGNGIRIMGGYLDLSNSTIARNRRSGIRIGDSMMPTMIHSTVADNLEYGIQGKAWTISDSIIWGNRFGSMTEGALENAVFNHCCVEGELALMGSDNIASDPQFCGWVQSTILVESQSALDNFLSAYSLALNSDSPCIGSGSDGANMGAEHGVCAGQVNQTASIQFGVGAFNLNGHFINPGLSLLGAGREGTEVTGQIMGCETGVTIADLTLVGFPLIIQHSEAPEIRSIRVTGVPSEAALVCLDSSAPVVSDSIFSNNKLGIQVEGESAPVFRSCLISDNEYLGANFLEGSAVFENCQFSNNGTSGARFWGSKVTLYDCLFQGNASDGIECNSWSEVELIRCQATGNQIGVDVELSSITLSHCLVNDNETKGLRWSNLLGIGAGDSVVECLDTVFTNNAVGMEIQEIDGFLVQRCLFEDNLETGFSNAHGGGDLRDCTFRGNVDSGVSQWWAQSRFTDCDFIGNLGMGLECRNSSPTISMCDFSRNLGVGMDCSGVPSPRVEFSTFRLNGQGGIKIQSSTPEFVNCTISANGVGNLHEYAVVIAGDSGDSSFLNCIIWENYGPPISDPGLGLFQYCTMDADELPAGDGNSNMDPMFAGWDDVEVHVSDQAEFESAMMGYRYSLAEGSPCIGSGAGGVDRGAWSGVVSGARNARCAILMQPGSYATVGLGLIHRVSLIGSGVGRTLLEGVLVGLCDQATIADLTLMRGGIPLDRPGTAIIRDCEMIGGTRQAWIMCGKAVAPLILDCSISGGFEGIRCWDDSRPILKGCLISGNSFGILLGARSAPAVIGCRIASNMTNGIQLDRGYTGTANIINSQVLHNGSNGLYALNGTANLVNCAFAHQARHGIYIDFSADLRLYNCTVVENGASGIFNNRGGDVPPTKIVNSIIWSPSAEATQGIGAYDISYSCIKHGAVPEGEGNINADPGLLKNRLIPASGSPCIDAGANIALPEDAFDLDMDGDLSEPIPIDLGGRPRFLDEPGVVDTGNGSAPIVDMGAFEFGGYRASTFLAMD